MSIQDIRSDFWKRLWKFHGDIKTWWYYRVKNMKRLVWWCRGWFRKDRVHASWIENARCLVICAHPDDETLYFSSVLRQKKPVVICMSGTGSATRRGEFYRALALQNVEGMMLNLPDVPYMAWVWRCFGIYALNRISRKCTAVQEIYTHSSTGESHHPHHYATSRAVKRAFADKIIHTTAPSIPENGDGRLTQEETERKRAILRECYPSQIKMLENWYPYWDDYLKTEFFEG